MLATQSFFLDNPTPPNTHMPGDSPYEIDSYTELLIHSSAAHDNSSFADSSSNGFTVTNSGVLHATGQSQPVGTSAIHFNSGDYLTVPDHTNLCFGLQAFTIDFWMKHVSGGTTRIVGQGGGSGGTESAGQWFIRHNADDAYSGYYRFATTNYGYDSSTWTSVNVEDGNWHHFALTKGSNSGQSAVIQLAVDGVFAGGFGNTTNGVTIPSNENWRNLSGETAIGAVWGFGGTPVNGEDWGGYLDEIRISKGIQRWTSNFTVYP